MQGSKSLEIIGILSDLALYGGSLATSKLAKLCFAGHGGSPRAYATLLKRLEANGLIELDKSGSTDPKDWVPQLTSNGMEAHAPPSPEQSWNAGWDGKWRLLTFDLPTHDSLSRNRLRGWLKALRFGKVQGSVWINHRSLAEIRQSFAQQNVPPDGILCMEGTFWAEGSSKEYIEKAWPLDQMQKTYADYLQFLDSNASVTTSFPAYQTWKAKEKRLWNLALSLDPLLPQEIWTQTNRGPNLALAAEQRRRQAIQAWQDTADQWTDLPDPTE